MPKTRISTPADTVTNTTAAQLSPTQRDILTSACSRADGAVFPVTTGPKGGGRQKVLAALEKRGFIVGDADVWFATSAAYAALGMDRPLTPTREDEAATAAAVAAGADAATEPEPVTDEDADDDGAMSEVEEPALRTPATRAGTKQSKMIEMLRRPEGATIAEIMAATGWLAHTVRGAIVGALKKRLGLTITSEKIDGRGRAYRIAA